MPDWTRAAPVNDDGRILVPPPEHTGLDAVRKVTMTASRSRAKAAPGPSGPRAVRRLARRLPAIAVIVVSLIVSGLAVAYRGMPTAEVDVDDGGIWVTNESRQLVGHLNYDSRTLDSALRTDTADFDIGQAGETVTLSDLVAGSVAPIAVAEVSVGAAVSLPDTAVAVQGGDRVGVLDPDEGDLWVASASTPASTAFTPAGAVATDMDGGAVTASTDGAVMAVSAAAGRFAVVKPGGRVDTAESTTITGLPQTASLTLTAVGDRPVALDADSGTLVLPDGSVRDLRAQGVGAGAVLQAPGPDADAVLIATPTALLSVPLDGGDVTSVQATSGGDSGTPAPPVRHRGCDYAAWSGSGAYRRVCDDASASTDMTVDTLAAAGPDIVFRTNRTRIILNSTGSGAVWLPDENMVLMDNWDEVDKQLTEQENLEDSPDTTDEIADPERNEENTPPDAVDDSFGVRPGRTTTLPVLQNDSDPDGDVLTAAATSEPGFGAVAATRGGRALQLTGVEDDRTGSTTFTYEASDGRAVDTATVTVTVHPWGQNEGPSQLRDPAIKLGANAQIDYNVLTDWIDPDGDQIYLVSATGSEGLEVRSNEDGTVSLHDLGGGPGPRTVTVVVSDGSEPTTGTLTVDVRDAGNIPPTANADFYVARSGEPLTLEPLANDTDANGDSLSLVALSVAPEGTALTPDLSLGTVSFSSSVPGSYQFTYTVSDGPSTTLGVIRVDVVPVDSQAVPVAEDDLGVLPAGGSTLVAPLANDSDPAGGVLVVQSIEVPDDLEVTLLDRHLLRVSAPAGLDAPVSVPYTVSNGQASATARVTVVPAPAEDDKRPPQLQPDSARVRVGDVGGVDVLSNDVSPAGLNLTVDPELVYTSDGDVGTPFVTGNLVRLEAGSAPGTLQVAYTVRDSAGNSATSTVTFEVVASGQANAAPRPQALTAWAVSGETTRIPVPLSGIDPDGDSVTLVGIEQSPARGTVELGTEWLEYTPATTGSGGTDVFTYIVEDRQGKQAVARVRVGVAPPSEYNQAPVAQNDVVRTRPDRRLSVNVTRNDLDADGDPITLMPDSLEVADDSLEPTASSPYVSLHTPAQEGSYLVSYGISDSRGGVARGSLTVNVDADAPLQAPLARDDTVALADLPADGAVRVDVLANDEDPDADRSGLTVSARGEGVSVSGDQLLITPAERRRLVVYTVTDADGLSASAVVSVPGTDLTGPVLDSTRVPVTVRSGEDVVLDVRDYVLTRSGRTPRITDPATLTASTGVDPGISLTDETHIAFHVSADYSGRASVSFTARDGAADDDSALSATLTLPLRVDTARNTPPTLKPTPIRVAVGEDAVTQDLALMVRDPDGADPATFGYAVSGVPDGVTATLSGHVLSVKAATDKKGPAGSLTVSVDDGSGAVQAQVPITIVTSTRPLTQVSEAVVEAAGAGVTESVDITRYTINPFPSTPLRITATSVQVGRGTVDPQGTTLNITPAAGFHGQMTVVYRVMDATGDADRVVEGTVRLIVRDRPDAPTDVHVSATGAGRALVTFQPGSDNGAPITGYTLTDTSTGLAHSCAVSSCELTGLANGVEHAFSVVAHNDVGDSPASAPSAPVLVDASPEAPAAPAAAPDGSGRITVSWQEPANEGSPITGYTVSLAGGQSLEAGASARSATFEGLVNGQTYSVTVTAHNAGGDSPPSPATQVTPVGPPGPPTVTGATVTGVTATQADLHVTWALGDAGGRTFTSATLSAGGAGASVDPGAGAADLTIPLPGDGRVDVTVTAYTDSGEYFTSPAHPVEVRATAPAQPTLTVTGATTTDLTVSWSVPRAADPAATATVTVDGREVATGQPENGSTTATGLTPGADHTITVTLTNAAGTASATATAATLPRVSLTLADCTGKEAGYAAGCRTYSLTAQSWPASLGSMTCTVASDLTDPANPNRPLTAPAVTLTGTSPVPSGIAVGYTTQGALDAHAAELVTCTGP